MRQNKTSGSLLSKTTEKYFKKYLTERNKPDKMKKADTVNGVSDKQD